MNVRPKLAAVAALACGLLLVPPAGGAAAKPKPAAPAASAQDFLTPRFPPGTRILFQGDSITDGGRGRSQDPNHILGQDYAYLLAATCGGHYPDQGWTFLNRGISGNKVTDLAARWSGDTLALKPDVLSILIGVNDAASVVNSGGSGGVTAQQYEQVYDQILQQAVAADPNVKLILCEPFIAQTGHVMDHPEQWNPRSQAASGRRRAACGEVSRPGRAFSDDVRRGHFALETAGDFLGLGRHPPHLCGAPAHGRRVAADRQPVLLRQTGAAMNHKRLLAALGCGAGPARARRDDGTGDGQAARAGTTSSGTRWAGTRTTPCPSATATSG